MKADRLCRLSDAEQTELKMEEVTVIDLLGAKDAEKQKRNEKHQESETIREVEE